MNTTTNEDRIIKHENGNYWVWDAGEAYQVMANGLTHATADSAYPRTTDGLSIAIVRCNYLAKRAAKK